MSMLEELMSPFEAAAARTRNSVRPEFGRREGVATHALEQLMMGALEPITSYPETYRQMRRESWEQAGRGIDQIEAGVSFGVDPSQEAGRESASGAIDLIKGVGNTALGTLGYVASPVNAAIRTIIGKPVQDLTGIPAEYTDFAASLALPGYGFVRGAGALGSGVRGVAAENKLASKSTNLYNPPAKSLRPFAEDYKHGAPADSKGQLTHDIEERPLVAERIVGRQIPGGPDIALPETELPAIVQRSAGARNTDVPAQAIGGDAGRLVKTTDRRTGNSEYEILVRPGLSGVQTSRVAAHETGHLIDDLAGKISTEGLNTELRQVYNTVNTGQERVRKLTGPQHQGYRGNDIPRELMAEAIRAYMADPNYLKTVAPKTAARIREFVNENPRLSKIIQFNSLASGAVAGSPSLIPVDHDPFAQ